MSSIPLPPPRTLYHPDDKQWFSKQLCILRAQIEAFAATPADLEAKKKGGMHRQPPLVGQVGIRCIHCKQVPWKKRAKLSESFPSRIQNIHQSVRNFQRHHFDRCQSIPSDVRKKFELARDQTAAQSKMRASLYWQTNAYRMGLVDAEDGSGIFVNPAKIATALGNAADECDFTDADLRPIMVPIGAKPLLEENVFSRPVSLGSSGQPEKPVQHEALFEVSKFTEFLSLFQSIAFQINKCHTAGICLSANLNRSQESVPSIKSIIAALSNATAAADLRMIENSGFVMTILSGVYVREDLSLLGRALYQHFTEHDVAVVQPIDDTPSLSLTSASTDGSTRPRRKHRRKRIASVTQALQDNGVPTLLATIVHDLIGSEDEYHSTRYHDFDELEEDLRVLVSNPARYLLDHDGGAERSSQTVMLQLNHDRLHGRDMEIATLQSSFEQVIVRGAGVGVQTIFISGYSGTGKSKLAEKLRPLLSNGSGHFISGKFDKLGQNQPMAVIFSAFDEYLREILEGPERIREQVQADVVKGLADHVGVLINIVPNLRKLVGVSSLAATDMNRMDIFNRLQYHFREFARAIASPMHPVVFFLDDLQWADSATLQLLSYLLTDTTLNSLLFVGSYRSNEVGPDHPLHDTRRDIKKAGMSMQDIELHNLNRGSINALIADSLGTLPRMVSPLSDLVYTKTDGNPLFVVQFLKAINQENLLRYTAHARKWEWSLDEIATRDIDDSVVELMIRKMRRLHVDIQLLLKTVACLGSRCNLSLIRLLGNKSDEAALTFLFDVAINEGLFSKLSTSDDDYLFKFSHDEIEQAAYTLIPAEERKTFHLSIARQLWERVREDSSVASFIFVIVDQFCRGTDLIIDTNEKIEVAWLCVEAAEKAISLSAHPSALNYVLRGTTLLSESDWGENYDLCLRMFSATAEAHHVTGNHDGAVEALSKIFDNSDRKHDRHDAYCMLLRVLFAQGKLGEFEEPIAVGIEVLNSIIDFFPSEPTQEDLAKELKETHRLLESTPNDLIMLKEDMQDRKKIAAMRILHIMAFLTFQNSQELLAIVANRMVQLSLNFGLTKNSSLGFALCAAFSGANGREEEARRLVRLALDLSSRYSDDRMTSSVLMVTYSFFLNFIEPAQACMSQLKNAYQLGMQSGAVNAGFSAACLYTCMSLQLGTPLITYVRETKILINEMRNKRSHMEDHTNILLQVGLNLTEIDTPPEDPTNLAVSRMNDESIRHRYSMICLFRMYLAYIFGEYELAAEMIEVRRNIIKARPVRGVTLANEVLLYGLVACVMAQESDPGKWRAIASESVKRMKNMAECSDWNFEHKYELLKAEMAYRLNGEQEDATVHYDKAIQLAGLHGFINDRAMASECAGIFHASTYGPEAAVDYFVKAKQYYSEWGATRKSLDISNRHHV